MAARPATPQGHGGETVMRPAVPPERRRRRRRRLLWGVLVLAILGAITTLGPWLLSMPPLRGLLVWRLGAALGAELEVSALRLERAGRIHLESGRLRWPRGRATLAFERLDATISILELLGGDLAGDIIIDRPRLVITHTPGSPDTPVTRCLDYLTDTVAETSSGYRLTLHDARLRLLDAGLHCESRLQDLEAALSIAPTGAVDLSLACRVAGATGEGSLRASVRIERRASGGLDLDRSGLRADADLHGIELAPLRGILAPLLGVDDLSGKLEAQIHARADARAGLALEGQIAVRSLRASGATFAERPLEVQQADLDSRLSLDLAADALDVPLLRLSIGPHSLLIRDGSLHSLSHQPQGALAVTARGQLSRIASRLRGWIGRQRDFGGRFDLQLAIEGDTAGTTANLEFDMRHAVYVDKEVSDSPLEVARTHLGASGQVGPGGAWLTIDRLDAESGPLALEGVTGQITDLRTTPRFELEGHLLVDLDDLTRDVLGLLAPGLRLGGLWQGAVATRLDDQDTEVTFDGTLGNGYAESTDLVPDGIAIPSADCRVVTRVDPAGRIASSHLTMDGDGFDLELAAASEPAAAAASPGDREWTLTGSAGIDLAILPAVLRSSWPEALDPNGQGRLETEARFVDSRDGLLLGACKLHGDLREVGLSRRERTARNASETKPPQGVPRHDASLDIAIRPTGLLTARSQPYRVTARVTTDTSRVTGSGHMDLDGNAVGLTRAPRIDADLHGDLDAAGLAGWMDALLPWPEGWSGDGRITLEGTARGALWGSAARPLAVTFILGGGAFGSSSWHLALDEAGIELGGGEIRITSLRGRLDGGELAAEARWRPAHTPRFECTGELSNARPGASLTHMLATACPPLFVTPEGGQMPPSAPITAHADLESLAGTGGLAGRLEISPVSGTLPAGSILARLLARSGPGSLVLDAPARIDVRPEDGGRITGTAELRVGNRTVHYEGWMTRDGELSGRLVITRPGSPSERHTFEITGTSSSPEIR